MTARSRNGRAWAACVALAVCATGCTPKSGRGTVGGVDYAIELPGPYRVVDRGTEHVWIPRDLSQPMFSVRAHRRGARVEGTVRPCDPREDDDVFTGSGFILLPGDPLRPAQGRSLSTRRCLPPGARTLGCLAWYEDGQLSPAREAALTRVCRTLRAR